MVQSGCSREVKKKASTSQPGNKWAPEEDKRKARDSLKKKFQENK